MKIKVKKKLKVVYDSQDNIIRINNGEWIQSVDLDTFEPANDLLGIRHDWDNKMIYIKSNSKQLINVEIEVLANYSIIHNNVAFVYIPLMRLHLEDSDVFGLEIEISQFIPIQSYLKQKIKELWQRF
jgi:hypothetical protein